MVLQPSDYSLPEPGERMNPMDGVPFLSRVAGMVAVLSVVAFAWRMADNRGAPFIDRTLGSLTGGLLSTHETGGPWEDA